MSIVSSLSSSPGSLIFSMMLSRYSVQRRRELFEQLDRASLSTLLNMAEGSAKRRGR